MKYARELLSLTGRGYGAAAMLPQLVVAGVVASALAATLPAMSTRLIVYELAAWLLTRTPSGGLIESEVEIGLAEGAATVRPCELVCPAELLPPPHAAVKRSVAATAAFAGAERKGRVPIPKGQLHFARHVTFPVRSTL